MAAQGDWTSFGDDWDQRDSPLKSITSGKVARVAVREMLPTGISRLGWFEHTPVVTGGGMDATTP